MKKQQKAKKKRKPRDNNRLLIDKTSLNIKSDNPPDILEGGIEVHEAKVEDIVIAETFKPASDLTAEDELKYELGKVRSMMVSWTDFIQIGNGLYKVLVDPLEKKIQVINE